MNALKHPRIERERLPRAATDPPGAELSTLPPKLTPQQCADIAAKPLRMLPLEWRGETWKFWAFWSHLLPNQLTLSVRIREWIDDGLTLEDLRRVYGVLTSPDTAAEHKFAGELMADLANECRARIRARRRDEMARREHEARRPRAIVGAATLQTADLEFRHKVQ